MRTWGLAASLALAMTSAHFFAMITTVDASGAARAEISSLGNSIVVVGGDSPEQITLTAVGATASKLQITDSAGFIDQGRRCKFTDPATAVCPRVKDVSLYGGGGSDRIEAIGRLHVRPFLAGDNGNDVLIDGLGKSYQLGGAGADRFLGGPGHDRLFGEDGRDTFYGGRGPDAIDASELHGVRGDRTIDCGRGADRVVVDALDPAPRSCEQIKLSCGSEDLRATQDDSGPAEPQ